MKINALLIALILAPLALTACSKSDKTAATEQGASEVAVVNESETVTPEQQKAIDSIDKPVLDEKNTDVPAEKANAPADAATPAEENKA
ncbi:hypothetical protein EC844_11027 [Acinetobacter calcoaceticus]|uniref:Lipoprotein n=1 Tax=Acinetobacter calcoaceticus TaxID=471 RepID=A0A4R1XSY9_ACICA|nr:hypothetical protein EC844_11027 [Acinetobacter calcoaceticus]